MKKFGNIKLNKMIIAFILVISMILCIVPIYAVPPATGEAAYEITNYDYNATVGKDHKYKIEEKITVNLTGDLEKLSFAIANGNFKISDLMLDGNPTTEQDFRVDVTNLDSLKEGYHTYKISYTISEYKDQNDTRDTFYLDLMPPAWDQSVTKLNIKVKFPKDFSFKNMQYYAGQYGVQNVNTKLKYEVKDSSHSVTISGERIPGNFGIALEASLPNDYWQGELDGTWSSLVSILVMLGVVILLLIMWFIGGRDPKLEKVLQAHPIEGISPAEVSYISNGRIRTRDVITLIVYFGTRGYLQIVEYEPKRFKLIRKSDPGASDEERFIRTAYELLFEDIPLERWLDMDDIAPRIRRIKNSIKKDVAAGFSSKDMAAYTPLSRIFRIIGIAITTIAIGVICALKYLYIFENINWLECIFITAATGILLVSICKIFDEQYYEEESSFTIKFAALCIGYFALAIVNAAQIIMVTGNIITAIIVGVMMLAAAMFIVIMRARAEGNATLANRFRQLRHFIYHPDAKVMLNAHIADNNYYYEVLPYALMFNGLETWAIAFIHIEATDSELKVPEPDWFIDEIEGHAITNLVKEEKTVLDYAKDIKSFARTIENAYHSNRNQGRIKWQINKK